MKLIEKRFFEETNLLAEVDHNDENSLHPKRSNDPIAELG